MLPVSIYLPQNPFTGETFQKYAGGIALEKNMSVFALLLQ